MNSMLIFSEKIMNFYKHFIGDYQRDTMHLTMMQDGAYRRLLDACYATERVLPADTDACYRLARAFTKDERDAADAVLSEFFPVGQDGVRHNKRTEKELANATAYADAQSMRAHMRWHKQADVPVQSPEDASHSHSHSQTPQPDSTTEKDKVNVGPEARRILAFLNEKAQRRYQANRVNLRFIESRLKDGATPVECRQVIVKKCREWKGDPKMELYLRPATLFNSTKFAQYQGELVAAPEAPHETS